ncbi:hypothetical protein BOQ55_05625 [Lacticaseibacillus casei]|nr:hypothetical protein BOQ55_05625 [Lacticaseibacillus casei]
MSECEYCKFRDKYAYSSQLKMYEETNFADKHLRFLLVGLMRQDSGHELTVSIGLPDIVYQRGIAINYCPMCGRKLEDEK